MNENLLFVCDAYEAGFNIEPVNLNIGDGDNTSLNSLKMTRDNTDYMSIENTTLFSINGLIFPTNCKSDGIYVIGGNVQECERVIMIRTNKIGNMIKHEIDSSQILNLNNVNPSIAEPIFLKTEFDLMNSFFMLIIAGFLFINDDRLIKVSANKIMVKQLSLDLEKKYVHSHNNFNNSYFDDMVINNKIINREDFYNFNSLVELFTAKNSFIISIDNNFICEKKVVGQHQLPGRYMTNLNGNSLLISNYGTVLDYVIGGNKTYPVIKSNISKYAKERSFTADYKKYTSLDFDPPFSVNDDCVTEVVIL